MKTKITVIGLGLIGSSICRAIKDNKKYFLTGYDINPSYRKISDDLNICDDISFDLKNSVRNSNVIILAIPFSSYKNVFDEIKDILKENVILTDVGSVKKPVCDLYKKTKFKNNINFIPAHPIAGTENSGPNSGFKELFRDRYTILCTFDSKNKIENKYYKILEDIWLDCGSMIEYMDSEHHDTVLGLTSHIPHLMAYTLVAMAIDVPKHVLKDEKIKYKEIIKYSAGGFRDATRVAASDPIMWRDIFISNSDKILSLVELYEKKLSNVKKAIKENDFDYIYNFLDTTRKVRKEVIKMKQSGTFDPREKN